MLRLFRNSVSFPAQWHQRNLDRFSWKTLQRINLDMSTRTHYKMAITTLSAIKLILTLKQKHFVVSYSMNRSFYLWCVFVSRTIQIMHYKRSRLRLVLHIKAKLSLSKLSVSHKRYISWVGPSYLSDVQKSPWRYAHLSAVTRFFYFYGHACVHGRIERRRLWNMSCVFIQRQNIFSLEYRKEYVCHFKSKLRSQAAV